MHMGYYEGEKSIGLGPIVIALSVVAITGFGLMYTMFGHLAQEPSSDDFSSKVDHAVQHQDVQTKHNRV